MSNLLKCRMYELYKIVAQYRAATRDLLTGTARAVQYRCYKVPALAAGHFATTLKAEILPTTHRNNPVSSKSP